MKREETIVHAYGVADRDTPEVSVAGLGGAPVRSLVVGPLRVLYSVLHGKRWGRAAWEQFGADPEWLRDVARSHHAVLQVWSERADILPFRLPSLHAGEAALTRAIRSRVPELVRALAPLRGRREWGVKVFLEQQAAPAPGVSRARTGRDYLVARARATADREDARLRREDALRTLHEAFSARATRAVLSAPHASALSGRRAPMLLNGAYLVERRRRTTLEALAAAWADRVRPLGLRVELTGPWPPYHFTSSAARKRRAGRGRSDAHARHH